MYLDNYDKCFDITSKKVEKIQAFIKKFEVLGNSLEQFKKNLNFMKIENIKKLASFDNDDESNISNSNSNNMSSQQEDELKDFLSDLQSIKEISPNIRENYTLNYDFYKGLIHFYVEKNFSKALEIFVNILNNNNLFMNSYFAIWRLLKVKGDLRILLNFSYFMVRAAHNSEVTYEDWVKAYILYSKALSLTNKKEEASLLLRNLLDIFANIPLDEVKFLSEIHKANRVSTTNNFINFDYALSFYSKHHVYKKSEAIFHFNYKLKCGKEKFKISEEDKLKYNLNEPTNQAEIKKKIARSLTSQSITTFNDIGSRKSKKVVENNNAYAINNNSILQHSIEVNDNDDYPYLNTNQENFEQMNHFTKDVFQNNLNNKSSKNIFEDVNIKNININTIDKLEEYVEKNIENIQISEDFTCNL
jgi:hypothetical protein